MVAPSTTCASSDSPLKAATVRVVRLLAAAIDHSVSPGCTVCGTAAEAGAALATKIAALRRRRRITRRILRLNPLAGNRRVRDYGTLQPMDRAAASPWWRLDAADLKLWGQKWLWYERNSLPWNRARIHAEFARRRAFCRWPLHGNVLELLADGRLELGEHVLLEPHVWLTATAPGRIAI